MRLSAVLSALFHVGIVVFAMTTFARPQRFEFDAPANIPVELLTLSDITNVSAAVEQTDEEIEIEDEVVEEQPEPEPEPEPVPQQVAALPDPVLELPEPEAEFLPEEDAEPEPEPEVIEPEPEPEPVAAPPPPAVQPSVRPQPPERDQGFNFDQAAALIDRAPREEEPDFFENLEIGDQSNIETAERARDRVGLGTGLTMSQTQAVKQQVEACWVLPTGVPTPEDKVVNVFVRFNRDGTLASQPEVLESIRIRTDRHFRTVAESAVRALIACESGSRFDGSLRAGYDFPADRYDEWREYTFTFDLATAMGLR